MTNQPVTAAPRRRPTSGFNPPQIGSRSFTWKHGRELDTLTENGVTWNYTYNADGLRVERTNGTLTYKYYYSGGQLVRIDVGNKYTDLSYDASGVPMSLYYSGYQVTAGNYYYVTNLQGDVVAILDDNGTAVVTYTYDAWGNILDVGGTMADTLGVHNPLRYRGYVYDEETSLYYLQSRYYDPNMGRFINSDVLAATGQSVLGNNMFAYCGNNPITRVDHGGNFWDTVFDVVSLCFSVAEVISDPTDVGAWVGLALDVVDVAVPFVGGLGETARAVDAALEVADAVDDVHDTVKVVENVDEVIDAGNAVITNTKTARSSAVRKAWKNEVAMVRDTGVGTRDWTQLEIDELLTTGKVKGYVGHHMKSVKGYPELAGDPSNIQFLTRKEHLLAHNGNWRNITHGRYVS